MKHIQSIVFSTAIFAATPFLAAQTVFNSSPSRIVGQAVLQRTGLLTASAVNLVEGREFNLPQGVAVDTSASPPILYVVDFGNNRVLAWKNAFGFTKGAPQADLVIGQRDFLSTAPQGPAVSSNSLSTGLFEPVALTVDKSGNLYVIDAGNNRILRYPTPFSQTGDFLVPDLIIGQKDLSGGSANEGRPTPNEKTLALGSGGTVLQAGLAFDAPQGNLWVSDPGNNRVLRFPASAIGSGAANEPAADRVLGHSDFTTVTIPPNSDPSKKNYLIQPSGMAFDPSGRLFVADDANRAVVYTPPFVNGQLSSRIMGVVLPTQQQPRPPAISESTLGSVDSSGAAHPPGGVFFVNSTPYVVDTGNSRILGYDAFDQWPDENTAFSPPAKVVIGQPNFTSGQSNRGLVSPSATTLSQPVTGVFAGTDLFVVDAGNNRVVVFPQQSGGGFGTANRLLGQLDFQYNAPNLIEGREFGFVSGGAAVIDASSNPPHLYVSDPVNNRVLGFLDYRKVNAGTKADLVIGQPDLLTAMVNFPSNSFTQANDSGLCSPEGLAVDSNGNLFVADGCNARVLRFPSPFTQPQGILPRANLVLGQQTFFGQPIKDLSRFTMSSAYGLAFSNEGDLLVSDVVANRVLFFRKPAGDFQSFVAANNVIGQRDFSSGGATTFSKPRGISIDADDQLYVADSGNNRIAILPNVRISGDNPPVLSSITGLSGPIGVFIDLNTDEIWVTNTNGNPNQVLRYPKYSTVINNPAPNGVISPVFGPISVTVDPFSNPVVIEAALNRVSFYYPAIDFTTSAGGVQGRLSGNAANYFQRFAPGMLSSIFAFPNKRFGDQTVINSSIPVPTTLGDVQVTVAGIPAPLLYVSPAQINFQVPGATPVGDVQEIQVTRASTGQVLASWLFRIDSVSPGLFTADATGSGQLLAVNQDGSINDATHPAKAGTYISLYGTGPGAISGLPPDGQPAQGIINTDSRPGVFINGPDFIPDGDVQFSGLAPGYVGLWQINAKIPANVPSGDVRVFIQMNGINSILDPNGIRRTTTIRVTP
jgi:uncharacterized protein (TIGR03437 family)